MLSLKKKTTANDKLTFKNDNFLYNLNTRHIASGINIQ